MPAAGFRMETRSCTVRVLVAGAMQVSALMSSARDVSGHLVLPENYVLVVGTVEPRKNLALIFAAYDLLPEMLRRRFPLVIAGKPGWHTTPIYASATHLVTQGVVRFIGTVTEKELVVLYQNATVFAYPSLEEGFGLPPLEAMSHGTPVIVSDAPVLVEVSGPGALVVSRFDPMDLARALTNLLSDDVRRAELADRGKRHAEKYTWMKTARETIAVYRQVAGR